MKPSLLAAIALASFTSTGSLAIAQPAPGAPVDAAETAYQEGKRLYDLQEWDSAIAKFKEAYRLRSDAASLFNIAQSYRLKGDCQNAISFYKTYKRNFPTAENTGKVDKFIADLEVTCTHDAAPPPPNPTVTNPAITTTTTKPADPIAPTNPIPGNRPMPRQPPPPPPPAGDPGHTKRLVGYTLFGVGGASLIGGVLFGVSAHSKSNDVTNGSGAWDPSLQKDGERAQRNSRILFGVGGAALIGGGVLYFLGHKQTEDAHASSLALAPTDSGASLVWSGRF